MNADVRKYFLEQYETANFRVVPGHWPDFKSKEEVDRWIKNMGFDFNKASASITRRLGAWQVIFSAKVQSRKT